MIDNLTVLLSAASSPTMPGLIDCFKRNGERNINIVGMDMNDEPSVKYLVNKFYCVPSATSPEYVDAVLDICRKEHVDIYFPNISAEVSAVVKRAHEFQEMGVKISVSNTHSIAIANNKLQTYEFMKEHDISVPRFYAVHSIEDFIAGCKFMGYPEKPVCLKVVDRSGSRGVRIIDATKNRYSILINEKPNSFYASYDDILSILKEADTFHEMMLVEYVGGNEYTVDVLADHGNIKYMVGRENVVSLMSIAQNSIVRRIDSAYETTRKLVTLLNVDGNFGIDFILDEHQSPILMDINPRITATVSLAAAAGVNLPYLRVKQLLGEKLPDCEPQYGTRLRRRYGEIYTNSNGEQIWI